MASGDIKGFYRQKKTSGGVTKPSSSKKNKASSAKAKPAAATLGCPDPAQPAALVSHGHGAFDRLHDDYVIEEETLRQFDLDMSYGPCLGMTRLERWERAFGMGLDPPRDVETLLREGATASHGKVELDCLWEGHI